MTRLAIGTFVQKWIIVTHVACYWRFVLIKCALMVKSSIIVRWNCDDFFYGAMNCVVCQHEIKSGNRRFSNRSNWTDQRLISPIGLQKLTMNVEWIGYWSNCNKCSNETKCIVSVMIVTLPKLSDRKGTGASDFETINTMSSMTDIFNVSKIISNKADQFLLPIKSLFYYKKKEHQVFLFQN